MNCASEIGGGKYREANDESRRKVDRRDAVSFTPSMAARQ
jgi:hypothetical protein